MLPQEMEDVEKSRERVHVITEAYQEAEFCLQPAGDTCERKGILDALLLGCIPVLFHPCQQHLWPLHWGGWTNTSSVLVNGTAIAAGDSDIKELLEAIPEETRKAMRASIADNGHRLQYAQEDPEPGDRIEEDAWSIIVEAVAEGINPCRDDPMALTQEDQYNLFQMHASHATNGTMQVFNETPPTAT